MTDYSQHGANSGRAWKLVILSFAGLFLTGVMIPMYARSYYVALPGTLTGIATAVISAWAYLACPRRPIIPKVMTFLLLVPGLFIGVNLSVTYLMYGLNR